MSYSGNYMDGVSVKISENYKRPPRIELPYSVTECPIRAQNFVDNVKYVCTFENNVLAKLKELRNAKETRKNERRHRLQLLEEAKQKKLDLIAIAEAEERLKLLSVSEVSYPSTDEISEISPDDRNHDNCENTISENIQEEAPLEAHSSGRPEEHLSCNTNLEQNPNILQPIQVMSKIQQNNLLEDPDPLQKLKMDHKIIKVPHYATRITNHNLDKLTFSDFENDTSSPFDNVELKTINDMELLAQVLHSQRESSTSCPAPAPCYTAPTPANYPVHTYTQPSLYNTQQPYTVTNGYYVPDSNCDNNVAGNSGTVYMPNYQYYMPPSYQPMEPAYYPTQMTQMTETTDVGPTLPNEAYIPQTYYYSYPPVPLQYQPSTTFNSNVPSQIPTESTTERQSVSSIRDVIKSRSRSVPDIVNEINEELVSAKLRASERSYNASPALKDVTPRPSTSVNKKNHRKTEVLPNPYDRLTPQEQSMCKNINSMGFALDRVARVCVVTGDNDKKVIESLLVVGELMDLGFPESAVMAALVKNDFNRDRALEDLIT